jgi:hypothetical protein
LNEKHPILLLEEDLGRAHAVYGDQTPDDHRITPLIVGKGEPLTRLPDDELPSVTDIDIPELTEDLSCDGGGNSGPHEVFLIGPPRWRADRSIPRRSRTALSVHPALRSSSRITGPKGLQGFIVSSFSSFRSPPLRLAALLGILPPGGRSRSGIGYFA